MLERTQLKLDRGIGSMKRWLNKIYNKCCTSFYEHPIIRQFRSGHYPSPFGSLHVNNQNVCRCYVN
eukprot:703629-Heterocapsa_arctica.AAC.1